VDIVVCLEDFIRGPRILGRIDDYDILIGNL
jgi:hypothetical protein